MSAELINPHDTIARLFALYEAHGANEYIGEPVSQLEHMWQATRFAQAEGCSEEVVLAAFFHDLGHLCTQEEWYAGPLMAGFGAANHEQLGANYLRALGFSERLAALVESHVLAKRYLTYKHPDYYRQLSPASQATLAFQGGVMSAAEADAFTQHPDADLLIRMRQWDDLAKAENCPVGSLAPLREMALRHLLAQPRRCG